MFRNIGFGEILLIALIALVLFGPNRLPEIARSLGEAIKEFKKSVREIKKDADDTSGGANN